ncbi:MAG: mobile mystery protein A [Pseudomonadota bacterium]
MRAQDRATARRQLDKRLKLLQGADNLARPPYGWIKAIREALGMTTKQLGKRLGVSQPRAVAIEKAEKSGSITLASLERAAHALDCRVVYALVPRNSLDNIVRERATLLARNRLDSTSHSMRLEAQDVDELDENEQLKQLIDKIIMQSSSKLWEDK